MSDDQIELLKRTLRWETVYWIPDSVTAYRVTCIKPHDGEPSEVAYIDDSYKGDYVALYNAKLADFKVVSSIKWEESK